MSRTRVLVAMDGDVSTGADLFVSSKSGRHFEQCPHPMELWK